MAVSAHVYGLALKTLTSKLANLSTDNLNAVLLSSTYTPNQDTHQFQSDLTGEVSGTGYTAGGKALTGVTVTYNGSTNTLTLDANDVSWSAVSVTARYVVIVDTTPGSGATNPLICYQDFGGDVPASSGTFTITWDPAGIVTGTVA